MTQLRTYAMRFTDFFGLICRQMLLSGGLAVYRLALACGFVLLLQACQQGAVKELGAYTDKPATQKTPMATQSGRVDGVTGPAQTGQSDGESSTTGHLNIEEILMQKGDLALRSGRLTEPAHNNAYDSFHSVLMLNPENKVARSGLQAILLRYAELTRNALNDGQLQTAANILRRAGKNYPENKLLRDLEHQLAEKRKSKRKSEEELLLQPGPDRLARQAYPIPGGLLKSKTPEIKAYLAGIARRLLETDESILIHARTDSEGRWIYKQLKLAVPGYRVRGDIRLARQPKITILPPIQ